MEQDNIASPRRGHYVEANGLNMDLQERWSGTPLVLLHNGTVSSKMWEPFLPSFVPHFRVITPGSRGHGKANNPKDEQISYPLVVDDIVAFINTLHLTKPLISGYSDGGQIALER